MATFEVQTTGCIWFTQRLCCSCGSVSKSPDWAENELHPPRRPLVKMLGMLTRTALNFLAPRPTSCSSLEFIGFAEMFSFRKLLRSKPSLSWGCRLWWDLVIYFQYSSTCQSQTPSLLPLVSKYFVTGFLDGSVGKESASSAGNTGDAGSIPRSGRSLGGGNGNPLHYSCLKTPKDSGAGRAKVHRVTKSQTRLSD